MSVTSLLCFLKVFTDEVSSILLFYHKLKTKVLMIFYVLL